LLTAPRTATGLRHSIVSAVITLSPRIPQNQMVDAGHAHQGKSAQYQDEQRQGKG